MILGAQLYTVRGFCKTLEELDESLKKIAEIAPSRVIYVSCNPDTLARDCKVFYENGYAVSKAFAADMF